MRKTRTNSTGRRAGAAALLLSFVLAFSGCALVDRVVDRFAPTEETLPPVLIYYDTLEFYAFGSVISVTCYGDRCSEACTAVREEFFRLDGLFSTEEKGGDLYQLNRDWSLVVSQDTASVFDTAIKLYWSTNGAFDVTMYPVKAAWGFTSGEYRAADPLAVEEAVSFVGSNRVAYDMVSRTVMLDPGQGVDFTDIAMGYACDRLNTILEPYGVTSALVVQGGKVFAFGQKPEGDPWRVGIHTGAEAEGEEYLGILSVNDKAVFTADPHAEYFVDGVTGEEINRLLDPATGYPVKNDLASVTVVASSGAMADGLSSALFVMGREKAVSYWQANRTLFDMILVTTDGRMYVTEPLAARFETTHEKIVLPVPAGS